eukprot:162910_1
MNLYPSFIIDDDMYEIWNYYFAASHLMHKIRQNTNKFSLKITVIPHDVICIYDENISFSFHIPSTMETYVKPTSYQSSSRIDTTKMFEDQIKNVQKQFDNINIQIIIDRGNTAKKENNNDKIYILPWPEKDTTFGEFDESYLLSLIFNIVPYNDYKHEYKEDIQQNTPPLEIHTSTSGFNSERFITYDPNNNKLKSDSKATSHNGKHNSKNNIIRCHLLYGLTNENKMRFFPEYLTTIIPRFFKKDEKLNYYERIEKIYDDKYKHGFGVELNDPIFNKLYKQITKCEHVSVNYNREHVIKQEE